MSDDEEKGKIEVVESEEAEELSFEEIMKRNKENAERMARERNSGNKSVLRSYRIKP